MTGVPASSHGLLDGATAGGDLTGTYPSPTVAAAKITAAKMSSGAATVGQLPVAKIAGREAGIDLDDHGSGVKIGNDQIHSDVTAQAVDQPAGLRRRQPGDGGGHRDPARPARPADGPDPYRGVRSQPTEPDRRRDLADVLITDLVRHAVAEEMYVYPAMREHLPDGASAVEHDLAEHQELEVTMKELESLERLVEKVGRIDLHAGEGRGLDALLNKLVRLKASETA